MTIKDLMESNEIGVFAKKCLLNSSFPEKVERVKMHWGKAKSVEEFKELVFADHELKLTQGYAELSKESEGHWYRVREMFGDRQFKTDSDCGGVLIGNEDYLILVSNGCGDGVTRVAVFEEKDFNSDMMRLNPTSFKVATEMYVYGYDCSTSRIVKTLDPGSYWTYYWNGFVAIVKYR